MDQQVIIFITIAGMAVVTYVPRALPLLALARKNLPDLFVRWLGFIPAAVLSAMLAPQLLLHEGRLSWSGENLFLWAALPTIVVCWKTKSFLGAILTGMACVALVRFWSV